MSIETSTKPQKKQKQPLTFDSSKIESAFLDARVLERKAMAAKRTQA